jgi:DNA-binding MarR family transcriptional regulator
MTSEPEPIATVEPDEPQGEISLGILENLIGFRIRRIQNHLSRSFNALLNRDEIRPGVFSALALISANPGMSQKTLAREVGFDKATIVAILDNMERLDWTMRQRSKTDRRRHLLFVTPVGEKALNEMTALARDNEAGDQCFADRCRTPDPAGPARQAVQALLRRPLRIGDLTPPIGSRALSERLASTRNNAASTNPNETTTKAVCSPDAEACAQAPARVSAAPLGARPPGQDA